MKKVLFIITSPAAGGTETYLIRFLEHVKGVETMVLCKKSIHGELEERYKTVTNLKFIGYLGLFNPLSYIKLTLFICKYKIDTICDFSGNFAGWDLLCAKFAHVPTRIVFYRESRNQYKPTFFKKLYAKVITLVTRCVSTKILSNSFEALNHFHPYWRKDKDKYAVIYNGLDLAELSTKTKNVRQLLHLPQDAFIVCHTGRYTEAKNHRMILECAKVLCRRYQDIIFILIGRGVNEAMGDVVEQYRLSNRFVMLGYRNDVLDVLKCADIFYFPSLNEGQPNALIEAMASGLPFVASDIPSIKEMIPKYRVSDLVDPNDLQSNVSAIERLYRNRSCLANYACAEWARKHFDATQWFNLFLSELI